MSWCCTKAHGAVLRLNNPYSAGAVERAIRRRSLGTIARHEALIGGSSIYTVNSTEWIERIQYGAGTELPKLSSSNYAHWSGQIQRYLMSKKAWKPVRENTKIRNETATTFERMRSVTPTASPLNTGVESADRRIQPLADDEDCMALNAKVSMTISKTISPGDQTAIRHMMYAGDQWLFLEKRYGTVSGVTLNGMRKQISNWKL
ncbi:uncharacterized protein PADG_12085 [Paracoccidioides brasiliensis Pb18]|uniref:DUF4219 domain-containing protein n=1 Tax=Paracoccidioides brasiliensis (strain Pb18) TaxID=502780 RepID=A0A0A0HT15_PARBD|nr:uncharacterized protein PADG_12085 [Paracoccidioides brasiliensis Pb18]KGM91777.1 hypothetical protein PADG_12085 [Paracoccidioides brasiliensis Pb18]